jgi:AcrR family transcriptional regulator
MTGSENLKPVHPRKAPAQTRSRLRFQAILDAAQVLIAERGVDAVPMSDIAQNAEISIGSLYQYFPDKAAVVATLAERFHQIGQDCAHTAFEAVTSGDELEAACIAMTDGYLNLFLQEPGACAVWQALQADARLQAISSADDAAHTERVAQTLARLLPQKADQDVTCLAALVTGLIASAVRLAAQYPPDDARCVVEMFKAYVLIPAIRRILEDGDAS